MAMTRVFTGANGTLTLGRNTDNPEGADADAILDTYETNTVGRVSGVTVRVDTQLEEFHEIGRRHAASLHPGNIHISGTVGRAYVNGALLMLLMGRGGLLAQAAEPYVQPTFHMQLDLTDPAVPGTTAGLILFNVHFQSWSYVLPEDDFVMEDLAFKALTISVVDSEAPAGGGEAVEKTPQFPEA
ncbi:MAG TPA: hypothetical protein VG318_13580 [Actinomycetota bacterium]|nr:hypothetical protein [Actinomycetota bacterium]